MMDQDIAVLVVVSGDGYGGRKMHKYVYVTYKNPKGKVRIAKVVVPKRISEHPERKLMTQQYCEQQVNKWNPNNEFMYWSRSRATGNKGRRKTMPQGRTNWS